MMTTSITMRDADHDYDDSYDGDHDDDDDDDDEEEDDVDDDDDGDDDDEEKMMMMMMMVISATHLAVRLQVHHDVRRLAGGLHDRRDAADRVGPPPLRDPHREVPLLSHQGAGQLTQTAHLPAWGRLGNEES